MQRELSMKMSDLNWMGLISSCSCRQQTDDDGFTFPNDPRIIARLQHQLERFRNAYPPRTKLPESVWNRRPVFASHYDIWQTAKALRLDYMGPKKRPLALLAPLASLCEAKLKPFKALICTPEYKKPLCVL